MQKAKLLYARPTAESGTHRFRAEHPPDKLVVIFRAAPLGARAVAPLGRRGGGSRREVIIDKPVDLRLGFM